MHEGRKESSDIGQCVESGAVSGKDFVGVSQYQLFLATILPA